MSNSISRPGTFPAPLAEILVSKFFIDVSKPDACIVHQTTGAEFPLSMLSSGQVSEIRDRACDQYVTSVLTCGETIDEDRATLFFISQLSDALSRKENQHRSKQRAARTSRTATHRNRPIRTLVAATTE